MPPQALVAPPPMTSTTASHLPSTQGQPGATKIATTATSTHPSVSISSHQTPSNPRQPHSKGEMSEGDKIALGIGFPTLFIATLSAYWQRKALGAWWQRKRHRNRSQEPQDNTTEIENEAGFKRLSLYVRSGRN